MLYVPFCGHVIILDQFGKRNSNGQFRKFVQCPSSSMCWVSSWGRTETKIYMLCQPGAFGIDRMQCGKIIKLFQWTWSVQLKKKKKIEEYQRHNSTNKPSIRAVWILQNKIRHSYIWRYWWSWHRSCYLQLRWINHGYPGIENSPAQLSWYGWSISIKLGHYFYKRDWAYRGKLLKVTTRIIEDLQGRSAQCAHFEHILNDVWLWFKVWKDYSISHVNKQGNSIAHALARWAKLASSYISLDDRCSIRY